MKRVEITRGALYNIGITLCCVSLSAALSPHCLAQDPQDPPQTRRSKPGDPSREPGTGDTTMVPGSGVLTFGSPDNTSTPAGFGNSQPPPSGASGAGAATRNVATPPADRIPWPVVGGAGALIGWLAGLLWARGRRTTAGPTVGQVTDPDVGGTREGADLARKSGWRRWLTRTDQPSASRQMDAKADDTPPKVAGVGTIVQKGTAPLIIENPSDLIAELVSIRSELAALVARPDRPIPPVSLTQQELARIAEANALKLSPLWQAHFRTEVKEELLQKLPTLLATAIHPPADLLVVKQENEQLKARLAEAVTKYNALVLKNNELSSMLTAARQQLADQGDTSQIKQHIQQVKAMLALVQRAQRRLPALSMAEGMMGTVSYLIYHSLLISLIAVYDGDMERYNSMRANLRELGIALEGKYSTGTFEPLARGEIPANEAALAMLRSEDLDEFFAKLETSLRNSGMSTQRLKP